MNIDTSISVFSHSINTDTEENQTYLSIFSPRDKYWDTHKSDSIKVSELFEEGYELHKKQALRIKDCAKHLEFGWKDNYETGESVLKLKKTYFCRVRHCPICQWRRSRMWVARFYQAFPKIYADHPEWRYIMVTLTVRNCAVIDLKQTIKEMNSAWQRLSQRKVFPALGFIRTLEITRGSWVMKNTGQIIPPRKVSSIPVEKRKLKDKKTAHPHYHCLIAVPPSYFGKRYLSTAKWSKLWQEALRIDYTPICDVRIVKPRDYSKMRGKTTWETPEREEFELSVDETRNAVKFMDSERKLDPIQFSKFEYIFSAVKEVIKYAVKPSDMLLDSDWLFEMSTQLRNVRAVALGGEFKKYLKEPEKEKGEEDLIGKSNSEENEGGVFFGWRERSERYQRKN